MIIKKIRLYQFRNQKYLEFEPDSGINIIYGGNGVGKTNILEGISFALNGRSIRSASEREMIQFDKEEGAVFVELISDIEKFNVQIRLNRGKAKEIRINGERVQNYRDYSKIFSLISFTPEDIQLVKGGPSNRRIFLDNLLKDLSPVYFDAHNSYQKALLQRNTLLKTPRTYLFMEQLNAIDSQLIKAGAHIIRQRKKIIKKLDERAKDIYMYISEGEEYLSINYESDISTENSIKNFVDSLSKSLKDDIKFKNTSRGPHRDEMDILLNKKSLRSFGSQGQQRSVVLALKLAETKIKEESGQIPVLLLDDIYSELDKNRQRQFNEMIKNNQSFISSAEAIDINAAIWHLNEQLERKR